MLKKLFLYLRKRSRGPALLLLAALAAFYAAGCAPKQSPMAALMPGIRTMNEAHLYLGYPASSREEADGATRHEWLLDNAYHEQGKWILQKAPGIYYDSDGYPVEIYREVWRPAREVRKYCRIVIVADAKGQVLSRHWEGQSCADLIRRGP